MPRAFGAETVESRPEASWEAGNAVDERLLHSEMGDVQPDGQYDDSAPEYPDAQDNNPDNRWTES